MYKASTDVLSMARLDQRTHARMYSSAVARNGSPEGPSRHAEWPLIGGLESVARSKLEYIRTELVPIILGNSPNRK